ncbi:MAG: hypothetical protein ACPH9U_06100, partial [Candidatus Puniceispirillaceae bacterium]
MDIQLGKRVPSGLFANLIILSMLWRQLTLSDGFLCINCLLCGRFTDVHYRRLSFRVCFGVFYVS